MEKNLPKKKDWYCIKFDVPKNKNITALEFYQKVNSFLEQIDEFNRSIVGYGVSDTCTIVSSVGDFESGSLTLCLVDQIKQGAV